MKQDKRKQYNEEYVPENGQFATDLRDSKRNAFQNKQDTQQKAHSRRQRIRELFEDQEYN